MQVKRGPFKTLGQKYDCGNFNVAAETLTLYTIVKPKTTCAWST